MAEEKKTLGAAIDEIVKSLQDLDEASKIIAIKAACDFLKVPLGIRETIPTNKVQAPLNPETPVAKNNGFNMDIKSLKEEKKPKTAIEMACIVAFYLENTTFESEQKATVSTEDIEKYFKQASYPLPKVPKQVLIDAKSAGYFDSLSKGNYKLNPVGYNLVAHKLPKKQ